MGSALSPSLATAAAVRLAAMADLQKSRLSMVIPFPPFYGFRIIN
jgi:hypothetical protein